MKALRLATMAILATWAGMALAQEDDFLITNGKLSSEDFYRLVSCRALPGGPCTADPVHWAPERRAAWPWPWPPSRKPIPTP